MMSFDELCGSALGAADYTAISEAFHTVFVHGIPTMNLTHLNQVRRDEAGRARPPPRRPLGLFSVAATIARWYSNVEATIAWRNAGRVPFSRPVLVLTESVALVLTESVALVCAEIVNRTYVRKQANKSPLASQELTLYEYISHVSAYAKIALQRHARLALRIWVMLFPLNKKGNC